MAGMTPEDVNLWLVDDNQGDNLGHAVAFTQEPFAYTACGMLSNVGSRVCEMPENICPECLSMLRSATQVKKT